jgi:hypothetical protein
MDKKDKKEYKILRNEVRKLDIIIHLQDEDELPTNILKYLEFLRNILRDIYFNDKFCERKETYEFIYNNLFYLDTAIENRQILSYQKELFMYLRSFIVDKMNGIMHDSSDFINILQYFCDEIIRDKNENKKTRKHKGKKLQILSPIAEDDDEEKERKGGNRTKSKRTKSKRTKSKGTKCKRIRTIKIRSSGRRGAEGISI